MKEVASSRLANVVGHQLSDQDPLSERITSGVISWRLIGVLEGLYTQRKVDLVGKMSRALLVSNIIDATSMGYLQVYVRELLDN